METLFRRGFQVANFRPLSRRLGQEDLWDVNPPADTVPNLYTSIDQDLRPVEPLHNAVVNLPPEPKIPAQQPAGTSDTDWAKLLAAGLKAAAQGYGAYTQEEISRMNTQAARLKDKNPSVAPFLNPDASSSTTPYLIVGVGALGLLGLLAILQ